MSTVKAVLLLLLLLPRENLFCASGSRWTESESRCPGRGQAAPARGTMEHYQWLDRDD